MLASVALFVIALAILLAGPLVRGAEAAVPDRWQVEEQRSLAPGVELSRLRRDRGPVRAVVVRVSAGAPVRLRSVLSNDWVAGQGPLSERTTEMCRRVSCVAALNGDFAHPDTGQPMGGVVENGQLLRSPVSSHHQLWVGSDGSVGAGPLSWSGRLVFSDLTELALSAVNVGRAAGQLVLYTPAYGPTTGTNSHGVELALRIIHRYL